MPARDRTTRGFANAKMAPSRPLAASKQTTESAACTKERSSLNPAVSISRPGHRISKQRRPAAQSKTPAPQPDKILTDVLIAIKPVHLANIVSRLKNHEYRKYRLGDAVTRLWLYETSEGGTGRSSITYVSPARVVLMRLLCLRDPFRCVC